MKAAIYARVSTEEQLTGYSIDAQLNACRKLCMDRGWSIAAEFTEQGESGKSFERRTRWREFMQAARNGDFDVLVTHKIDRFSRATILDSLQTLQTLKALNITFASASEPIDLTQPFGEFMLVSLLFFARHYLTNLSSEVTKGRRGRAESGRSNANRPPFGYRRNDAGDDEPDPQTLHFARAMFERYESGGSRDSDIARWLNAQGARTLDGNLFTAMSVRELLTNPFYAGWIRYRGVREPLTNKRKRRRDSKLIHGLHQPIISQATFDRCQTLRKGRNRGGGRSKGKRRDYLLHDLAYCSHCGGRMKSSYSGQGALRYSCKGAERMIECEASGITVRESVLSPQIDAMIAALSVSDEIIARADELAASDEHIEQTQLRRAEIVAEMKRLDYLFQKGRRPQADYERDTERLEAELQMLAPASESEIAVAGAQMGDMTDCWHAAGDDNAARHDVLRAMLERVMIDPLTKRIVGWVARPEFAALFAAL